MWATEEKLEEFMEDRGISTYTFMDTEGRNLAESILHEGLHLVAGGVSLSSDSWSADAAQTCLGKFARLAPARELQTLAAEVVALRYFGVPNTRILLLIHEAVASNWAATLRMGKMRAVFRKAKKLRAHQNALKILLHLDENQLLVFMRRALR